MNNTKIYKCDNCGVVETDEKRIQKCTGCNSSKILYCSRECQKLAWPSHKHRCRRKSNNAKKLMLNENVQNFDLVLSYASRYMKNLKYVNLSLDVDDSDARNFMLSANTLQSFLQSNRGQLETFVWRMDTNISQYVSKGKTNDGQIWTELHNLKVIQLLKPVFGKCQTLVKVINQQEDSILFLGLIGMLIGKEAYQHGQRQWTRNDCGILATSIGKCKNLVRLNLNQHYLRDSDVESLLPCLPKLQILNFCGIDRGGFLTDKSCKTISRACKELREIDLVYHYKITVAGLKRICKSCQHLRMFHIPLSLSSKDAVGLVSMASNLLSLHTESVPDAQVAYDIIMATEGRVVLVYKGTRIVDIMSLTRSMPCDIVSVYQQKRYHVSKRLVLDITRPDLVNVWDEEHLWLQI